MKKLFIASLFLVLVLGACTKGEGEAKELTLEEARTKAIAFINDYLVAAGSEVSIKETVDEGSVYKVVVNTSDGQEVNSYITKDGETFFPSGLNIEEFKADADTAADTTASTPQADLASITKTEKPVVELFVMSHCPFGTQIEKGILPALDALGDTIDFQLKFCDYAMHDKKELDEELTQYCIMQNEPDKLTEYLYCFLDSESGTAEESAACLDTVGINKSSIDSCVAATDSQYGVSAGYEDKSTWRSGRYPEFSVFAEDNEAYGITGSPSLVINGSKISASRDAASLLTTICAGFENAPEECSTQLSSVSPAAGFGFDAVGSDSAASCGN